MRISSLLVMSYVCCALSSCASVNTARPVNHTQHLTQKTLIIPQKKNPIEVSVFSNAKNVTIPYKIIGEAKVSNYNRGGIKRQDAIIHDAMRSLAASMGGDAVIDIQRTHNAVTGKVITYQSKIAV